MENHVVNFSGGRTSAYMVWLFEQRRKRENINVEYIYCDTGAEHPNTYKFIKDVVENFGIKLTCLRTIINMEFGVGPGYRVVEIDDCKQDLEPFMDVCRKHGTPTVAAPLCSDRMKGIPADKYCNDKYGRGNYYRWLGMRVDEQSRIKTTESQLDMFEKTKPADNRIKTTRYLAQISDITKSEVLDWWEDQEFNLDLPEHLGNCVFCIKKGSNKIALAAKDEPDMAAQFMDMIASDAVHKKPSRDLPPEIMYRGSHSLKSIIDSYENISREDLSRQVLLGGSRESLCSESCEAGVVDPDLFNQ
jgi:3'-phosphoadenosine 5'-phosphosulfate sulfotransferase (PAPS reductase)/FAD synthetase